MVPKLKEVQEDVDKAVEDLEEDLVVTLTVMEPKVFGILLPKLFWPTVRKNCSSDWEKLLKFEAEGRVCKNFEITRTIYSNIEGLEPKIQQTKMLVTCQRFGDWFLLWLVWQYSSIQKNIIKVGAKSWMLTCSCHITLSLPFYTDPDSKRELNFCNGYLSLLYFWLQDKWYL